MITHRTGSIMAADRLVILRDGAIQFSGPRDEVLATLKAMAPARPPAPAPAPPGSALAT